MNKKSAFAGFVSIFLAVVLSSFFFIGIYYTDNKYTKNSIQPINGMLVLNENALEKTPSIFLIRGWSFYPNTLLTPDEFNNGGSEQYSTYVSIGENTGLTDENGVAPHGCGTYVLRLSLPEKSATYGLYIPEIYSSYRLYIDNEEVISLGTPEKENYASKTANRMITFDHSGGDNVTIMIAVNNESYLYGGMVYPPSFGTPKALNYHRGINLGLYLATISVVSFIMIFCLFFAIKLKHQNCILYTFICLSTIVFIGYPIIHTTFELPVFSWYAIETTCGYIVIFLIILLHNRICTVRTVTKIISTVVSGIFCVFILLYSLSAAYINGVIIDIVSYIIFGFKLSAAAYLLITGRKNMSHYKENYKPLFYASLFYAISCIWDRILPMYEPIYGGSRCRAVHRARKSD